MSVGSLFQGGFWKSEGRGRRREGQGVEPK